MSFDKEIPQSGNVAHGRGIFYNPPSYLFCVAMDILPVAALSVTSERVFSSSKLTDALRRNRLSETTFEVLQVLKFTMKRERLELPQGWKPAQENELDESGTQGTLNIGEQTYLLNDTKIKDFVDFFD